MNRILSRVGMVAVAAMLMLTASSASATTVSFYTVGYFNVGATTTGAAVALGANSVNLNGNTFTSSGTPDYFQTSTVVVDGANAGVTTIEFVNSSRFNQINGASTNVETHEISFGPVVVNFGAFRVTTGDNALLNGLGFTLLIYQLAPASTPDSAEIIASVSGNITSSASNGGQVTFTPNNVVYIPDATGVEYVVETTDGFTPLKRAGGGYSGIEGTAAVPLPGIAVAGFFMLGGVASLRGLQFARRGRHISIA